MGHKCTCKTCHCNSKSKSNSEVDKKSRGQVNTNSPYGQKEPSTSSEYR